MCRHTTSAPLTLIYVPPPNVGTTHFCVSLPPHVGSLLPDAPRRQSLGTSSPTLGHSHSDPGQYPTFQVGSTYLPTTHGMSLLTFQEMDAF